jgi:hypothetical protein
MKAHVGDRLVLEAIHVGEPRRIGVITEVRHHDGTPPYIVRWLDNDHESMVFPGSEGHIEAPNGQP